MRAAAVLLVTVACGAPTTDSSLPAPRCAKTAFFDGQACRAGSRAQNDLARGVQALAEFRPEQALVHLERAAELGPHRYQDLIVIYEQLGIAYGYLDREADALRAFERLLTIAPNHLLSYSLGPKATERFETARQRMRSVANREIDVSWPRKLRVGDSIPLRLEVLADPNGELARAVAHVRRAGTADYGDIAGTFAEGANRTDIVIPAITSTNRETLELFVTGYDQIGNEVLRWSSADRPREILLGEPPPPWYRRWQVWAGAGTIVAIATGTVIYLVSQEPPNMIPVDVR